MNMHLGYQWSNSVEDLVSNVADRPVKGKGLPNLRMSFLNISKSGASQHWALWPTNVDRFNIYTSFRVVESDRASSANSYLDMAFFSSTSALLKPDRRT
jgi:hypothetical protein